MTGPWRHPPRRVNRRLRRAALVLPYALLAALAVAGAAWAMPLDRDEQVRALATCQGRYQAAAQSGHAGAWSKAETAARMLDALKASGSELWSIRIGSEREMRLMLNSRRDTARGQAAMMLRACDMLMGDAI